MEMHISHYHRCHKRINMTIDDNAKMFVCPSCKVYVANKHFKINKKMEDKMAEEISVKEKLKHLTKERSVEIANEIIAMTQEKFAELDKRMTSLVLCKAGVVLRKQK